MAEHIVTPIAGAVSAAWPHRTEHAHLSPSGSRRWMACPGSLTLEAAFPDESNDAADNGTACHTVAAWCLTEHYRATKRVGEYIVVSGPDEPRRAVLFDEDMAEEVQGYVDTVRALAIGHTLLIETRVDFSEYVQVPESFGTADAAVVNVEQRELFMIDAKFGYKFVDVTENTQLMLYALGLYRQVELQYDIETVRLGIYQPKQGGLSEWTCSIADLLKFADYARSKACSVVNAERLYGEIQSAEEMREWEDTFLHPNPNEQDCMFCRAMSTCPAMARKVQAVVGADFQMIAEDKIPIAKHVPMTDSKTLAQMMASTGMIEDWYKAVRAETERRLLLDPQAVPGFGLETGREGNRRWADAEQAENQIRKVFRLTLDQAYNLKLKSPTQVEEMLKPEQPGAKPVLGPRQWTALQKMIVRNPPKPSVKPAHVIKKPYVLPTPSADDFSTVVECDLA
jgi:hypothetical protein